jgi:hypothetical protein
MFVPFHRGHHTWCAMSLMVFLNSTITLEFNHLDMSATAGGAKVSGKSGTYIQFKPGQALVYAVVGIGIKLLSSIQFGEIVPAILEGVGIGG